MHRFDQASAAFEGFSRLGRGVPAFFALIVAGYALGRECGGEPVYWPTVTFEALFNLAGTGAGVPVLGTCLALLVYTEKSRSKILYVTFAASTTLAWLFHSTDELRTTFGIIVCLTVFLGIPALLKRIVGASAYESDDKDA